MVAISLYRGNLHRVPDAPRRWLMPNHTITLKEFKSLLNRRSKALSRLHSLTTEAPPSASNQNPNSLNNETPSPIPAPIEPKSDPIEDTSNREEEIDKSDDGASGSEEIKGQVEVAGGGLEKPSENFDVSMSLPVVTEKGGDEANGDGNSPDLKIEKGDGSAEVIPELETTNSPSVLTEKEKRKKEIEEKLKVLNQKKHKLVQVLKQILNVEEELKRRNSAQAMTNRLSTTLQVDVSNDSGSMSRQVTPRMSSEVNLNGDGEGGEAEDGANHNIHARYILQTSSISPSSESPHRKPPFIRHNVVPHPSRSGLATVGSPSRFAPTGHQGHPANLSTVSGSGTNYFASSPSPVASGGTSAFKDARMPSPWS